MKLSVVIPCYNERTTIEAVVEAVRSAPVEDVEIIVVDDGSTDGTQELLKANLRDGSIRSCCRKAISGKAQLCVRVFRQLRGPGHRSRCRPGVLPENTHPSAPILEDRADVVFGSRSWAVGLIAWFTSGTWWETAF